MKVRELRAMLAECDGEKDVLIVMQKDEWKQSVDKTFSLSTTIENRTPICFGHTEDIVYIFPAIEIDSRGSADAK